MSYRTMQRMFGAAQFARNGLGAFGVTEERDPGSSTAAPYAVKIKPGALVDTPAAGIPVKTQESASGFWTALKSLMPTQAAPTAAFQPVSLNEGPGIGAFILIGIGVLAVGMVLSKAFK